MAQIPTLSVIEPLPTGRIPHDDLPALVARVAQILAGRPWVPVVATAAYPGFDTTPIYNIWTEPHQRPAKGPNLEWACAIVLGDAANLRLFEKCLQAATGLSANPAVRYGQAAA